MSSPKYYNFGNIPNLSSVIWTAEMMSSRWKWYDKSMESVIQRFIITNQPNFDYLGIVASIEDNKGKPALKLTTSNYVGAIPIYSPKGQPAGDLYVTGRYGEDASELMSIIGSELSVEFASDIRLFMDSPLTPPILLECCKYIDLFVSAERLRWHKFNNRVEDSKQPSASTLWNEYALRTAINPFDFDLFKNKRNILTTDHVEWRQLCYVLQLAISEIDSFRTPCRIQSAYRNVIASLRTTLHQQRVVPTSKIPTHTSDPIIIKELKRIASLILDNKTQIKTAWRVDYAKFFEVFVQYLIREVGKNKGAREISNPHYHITTSYSIPWSLKYLEPDIVLNRDGQQYVIDAKYKSHMFNLNSDSEELRESFRHDFHQILAYSALNSMPNKKTMLIYPFSDFVYHSSQIRSPYSQVDATVYLVGVPMVHSKVSDTITKLSELVSFEL